jgi:iron(III) transport system substrate-binding protein
VDRHSPFVIRHLLLPGLVIAVVALLLWTRGPDRLVIYCAHDSIYAEGILRDFEKRTGVPVAVKYDTEATKSLGLVELLIQEKDAPRCDVFWNNELPGTLDLQERGILEPYSGPGHARIPDAFKDAGGYWTGFAARLRVLIFNTRSAKPNPETLLHPELFQGDLSRFAIAKPLYGTTLTHYSVLWRAWGGDKLKAWHRDWRKRGVHEAAGNAGVKDLVAEGVCDLGFTDTDDFFEAKDDGKPVAAQPVRMETGATICIPNTIALIHGARHPENARKLIDFLLSEETELSLARSKSRQIPLGPVDAGKLPAEVRELQEWAKNSVPLNDIGPSRAVCLAWLKAEYLQ